jgi:hypothetical protein
MPERRFLSIWSVCLIATAASRLLHAQTISAELRGAVQDPSGAVIPSADISVKNVATGSVRATKSNGAGLFNVPDLQPSAYELTVSASGFGTQRRTNIELTVGAQQVLNITLTPSSVASTIEVAAAAPGVELANASLSGVEDAKTIRELPLNGRDWTQLALLQPGVSAIRTQNTLNGSSSNRGSRGFGSAVSIGGGRPTQNNYFLDGISQNDYTNGVPGSALGLALGVDAIQEFSVLTNDYNATYGGTSGGVVNAVTRSGANAIHGDAYEFLRNDKLDAGNFFDGPKPPSAAINSARRLAGPSEETRLSSSSTTKDCSRLLRPRPSRPSPPQQRAPAISRPGRPGSVPRSFPIWRCGRFRTGSCWARATPASTSSRRRVRPLRIQAR